MHNEHNKIRENLNKTRQQLNENVNSYDFVDAIKNHKVLYIYYAGDDTVMKGYRTIEPYLLGQHKSSGNTLLRAYQQAGASDANKGIGRNRRPGKDDLPGWRLFNVEYITAIHDTGKRFSTESGKIRPKYNPNDKAMGNIVIAVQPGEKLSDFNVGTNKSFDDVFSKESEFDKQAAGFKGFSQISKRPELIKKAIFDLYEFTTRYRKKRADNYIVVNKNGRIWLDLVKNKNKYSDKDYYGNLKELYNEYSGQPKGSKQFFDRERRKFMNS
jgi:hypothetical protein